MAQRGTTEPSRAGEAAAREHPASGAPSRPRDAGASEPAARKRLALKRPHTGRRRNEAARRAVLDATWEILREQGAEGLTIEAIAKRAQVGRQTIYRWWRSRADIVFEAASESAQMIVPSEPNTGSLRGDVRTFLRATYEGAARPETAPVLRAMAAEALRDERFAQTLRRFTTERRAVLCAILEHHGARPAQARLLADVAFGLLWDRTIIGHARPDRRAADAVTDLIVGAIEADAA